MKVSKKKNHKKWTANYVFRSDEKNIQSYDSEVRHGLLIVIQIQSGILSAPKVMLYFFLFLAFFVLCMHYNSL